MGLENGEFCAHRIVRQVGMKVRGEFGDMSAGGVWHHRFTSCSVDVTQISELGAHASLRAFWKEFSHVEKIIPTSAAEFNVSVIVKTGAAEYKYSILRSG